MTTGFQDSLHKSQKLFLKMCIVQCKNKSENQDGGLKIGNTYYNERMQDIASSELLATILA